MNRFQFFVVSCVGSGWLSLVLAAPVCFAQAKKATEEELTIPKPETMSLDTKDGVSIRCTYYPGGFIETAAEKEKEKKKVEKKEGKEVVPIIMLHGWGGRRTDYDALATTLQKLGHAVIVPDLRGHGDSQTQTLANGKTRAFEPDRMARADFANMVLDVEAVKKFLLEKNNSQELNIELLCVIGADLGAAVAVEWAALDWSRRQLPAFKQGHDVKALVLLSPVQAFKGFSISKSLAYPVVQRQLSLMVLVGKEEREAYSEAKQIYSRVEKFHMIPTEQEEIIKSQDLFFFEADTNLQGTKLLKFPSLNATMRIETFIDWRLVRKASEFTWTDRKSPLAQ